MSIIEKYTEHIGDVSSLSEHDREVHEENLRLLEGNLSGLRPLQLRYHHILSRAKLVLSLRCESLGEASQSTEDIALEVAQRTSQQEIDESKEILERSKSNKDSLFMLSGGGRKLEELDPSQLEWLGLYEECVYNIWYWGDRAGVTEEERNFTQRSTYIDSTNFLLRYVNFPDEDIILSFQPDDICMTCRGGKTDNGVGDHCVIQRGEKGNDYKTQLTFMRLGKRQNDQGDHVISPRELFNYDFFREFLPAFEEIENSIC